MANKILEKISEPDKIHVESSFLLKIKATRYLTYREIKNRKVAELKKITISQMRGV